MRKKLSLFLAMLLVSACTVGPDYSKPDVEVPTTFKETGQWDVAQPMDDIDRGAWWSVYQDPTLNGLEKQIDISNQNLKQAEANYRAAVAAADVTRAGLFPTVSVGPSITRSGAGSHNATTTIDLSAAGGWTIDLWGRIRRAVESEEENAQASAADLASARLSAQALLATDYFALRVQDELSRLYDKNVDDDQKILTIIENQYKAGIAAQSDVLAAQTQLESVRANALNVGIQRAQLEHAIAVLTGTMPANFTLAVTKDVGRVPITPPGVPSLLLERRPDIASAERQMASANAEIGVAEAAYYPTLTLSATYGFGANQLGQLFKPPVRCGHSAHRLPKAWSISARATPRPKKRAPISIPRSLSIAKRF